MNVVSLTGRLTRDPELRYTQQQTPVASFSIAVQRPRAKDKTDFIDCIAWRAGGEFVSKYFTKGMKIEVSGSLQSRSYEDKDGKKHKVLEVNCTEVGFAESKKSDSPGAANAPTGQSQPQEYQDNSGYSSMFSELDDTDGDLPF